MPQTIRGGRRFPSVFAAPIIETAPTFEDDWEYDPDLCLVSMGMHISQGATCEFYRRYGRVKMPFEGDFPQDRDPLNLDRYWVRVSIMTDQGPVPQFVGQVEAESRALTGSEDLPSGRQHWVAAGGLRLLQRIMISQAAFLNADNTVKYIDWIPPVNDTNLRGAGLAAVGNRTENKGPDDVYYYGGKSTWTHGQYIRYLIANFLNGEDGPLFSLAGQTSILENLKMAIAFPQVISAAEMLRELIPVKYGLDWMVRPTEAGYEIFVFALADASQSVTIVANGATVTMPTNPNQVQIIKGQDRDELFECTVVTSNQRRVDAVRVQGKRIVVCGSLASLKASYSGATTNLERKWSQALEDTYISPGSDDSEECDKRRKLDKFRDVYQHFGAPADWDLGGGTWSIACDSQGNLQAGDYQNKIRETLSWIPLKEGFSYITNPPTDNRASQDQEPDFKTALAWVYDPDPEDGTLPGYRQADQVGMHVGRPLRDWGIFLNASPNHKLALNHWSDSQLATTDYDGAMYDYDKLVATIAIESDHRIQLMHDIPDELAAGDGSIMTIQDDEAECWVMLPNTVVDVAYDGTLVTAGDQQIVLRRDTDRLALALAGAVGRYINERVRASLSFHGFFPWVDLVGNTMSVIQQGDSVTNIAAVISSVEFILEPSPVMIVKTGYA